MSRLGDRVDDDAAMLEICSHPLVRVDLDVGPGPRGSVVTTQACYHLPGKPGSRKLVRIGGSFVTKDSIYYCGGGGVTVPEGRSDGVLENIYGKLIVVVDKDTAVDPSYVVIKYHGRYYINSLEFVLFEAADALKSGANHSILHIRWVTLKRSCPLTNTREEWQPPRPPRKPLPAR